MKVDCCAVYSTPSSQKTSNQNVLSTEIHSNVGSQAQQLVNFHFVAQLGFLPILLIKYDFSCYWLRQLSSKFFFQYKKEIKTLVHRVVVCNFFSLFSSYARMSFPRPRIVRHIRCILTLCSAVLYCDIPD